MILKTCEVGMFRLPGITIEAEEEETITEEQLKEMEDWCNSEFGKGMRMTDQRRVIARVRGDAFDHPDVEELYARAARIDARISLATVYRTVKLFEEAGLLERHEFGDGRARYEDAERDHHDHLIDVTTGQVIEFVDPEIEALQEKIAARLGYQLIGHRLELLGVPTRKDAGQV